MAVAGSLTYDTKLDTKGFEKELSSLQAKAVAMGNIVSNAFNQIVTKTSALVKEGISYNAQIEQLQTSFKVMTGSAEEATALIQKLKKVGTDTPYELTGLASTVQLLMQYGMTSEEAYNSTLQLGDIAQGSAEKMQGIALALGQMSSYGKVTLQDVKQMIGNGFNPLQEIARTTGESMTSLYDRISKGTLTVEEVTNAFKTASSEGGSYFNSMEEQSKTFSGQLSTLKDNFDTLLSEASRPLFDYLTNEAFPMLNEFLENLPTTMDTLKENITGFHDTVKQFIEDHKEGLTLLAIAVGTLTTAIIANTIANNLSAIAYALDIAQIWLYVTATEVASAVTGAFSAVLSFLTSPITWVVLAIGGLIAIIVLLINNWESVKEVTLKVWETVKNAIGSAISWVGNGIKNFSTSVLNFFKELPSNVLNIGRNIVEGLWNGITGAGSWLYNKVRNFAKGILDNMKSALGIHSPSTVMRDMVGRFIPEGVAIGIEANTKSVDKAIDDMNDSIVSKMKNAVNVETGKINASATVRSNNSSLNVIQANISLDGSVDIDGQKAGRIITPFVTKTLRGAGAY